MISFVKIDGRNVITMICKDLDTYGWKVVASADVSAKYGTIFVLIFAKATVRTKLMPFFLFPISASPSRKWN